MTRQQSTHRSSPSLGFAAACSVAALLPAPPAAAHASAVAATRAAAAAATAAPASPATVARLRDEGPAALARLLARYDAAAPGRERDALGATIDAVAAQRYATVSRLYWYTDLAAARAAAQEARRPILALRMLGRLDEDLSCANSRLFRATLYANQDLARFLRDHFVLYWSSERPVPKVTIDFGDGRRLERTVTGNSAHYVLDGDGHVLDVLPGLYAPVAFRAELEKGLTLADSVRGVRSDVRARAVARYHTRRAQQAERDASSVAQAPYIEGTRRLLAQADIYSALAQAEEASMAKARMEVPDLRIFPTGAEPGRPPSDEEVERWAAMGQALYKIGDLVIQGAAPARENMQLRRHEYIRTNVHAVDRAPHVLDAASRTLIQNLHNAVPSAGDGAGVRPADANALASLVARLEQHIVADTAQNQLRLRPQISRHIAAAGGDEDFERLNTWIYNVVFHTPRADAWLGLLPRTDFTGLPGDGALIDGAPSADRALASARP